MLQKTYDWMIRTASHKNAPRALAAVSFAESSFFPIPPDIMLIPMILADRHKAWWYATLATIASVIGGIAGYAIGYFVFEYIGEPILRLYGYGAKFEEAKRLFNDWGVWILIAKGWTPFPFKILTISAGAFHMPLLPFVAASIVTRAMRFYLVAALLFFFGEPIRQFIETRLTLVTTAFVVLLVGGFVAARYVL
jgi:membrane protein YqaA with SNARE-associated domain